jgi:putative phage-type endonuclease
MKIIENMEQGSPEWLKFRESHITATDVSSILGTNPFVTSQTLFERKLGIKSPEPLNDRMRRGQELEDVARKLLIERTGIDFKPVVVIHDVEPWAMASLDGRGYKCDLLNPGGGTIMRHDYICEIKCPNNDTHQLALQGGIKSYYESQIQWQLWITGAEKCLFMSYFPDQDNMEQIAIVEVFPDSDYIESMVEKCRQFYEDHLSPWIIFGKKIPPETNTIKLRK